MVGRLSFPFGASFSAYFQGRTVGQVSEKTIDHVSFRDLFDFQTLQAQPLNPELAHRG